MKLAIFACFVGPHGPSLNQVMWLRNLCECGFFDRVQCVQASANDKPWTFQHSEVKHFRNNALKDIALFKKALGQIDTACESIVLINDSCELVRPLEKTLFANHEADLFWGLTLNGSGVPPHSYAGQVLRADNRHIQSYFMGFNGPAVKLLLEFQKVIELPLDCTSTQKISETQFKTVDLQEVGLSQFMLARGVSLVAHQTHDDVSRLYAKDDAVIPKTVDLSYFQGPQLVLLGSPCLKKKRMIV